MRYEGLLRSALFHHDEYKDEVRYAILRRDYNAGRATVGAEITKETAED